MYELTLIVFYICFHDNKLWLLVANVDKSDLLMFSEPVSQYVQNKINLDAPDTPNIITT